MDNLVNVVFTIDGNYFSKLAIAIMSIKNNMKGSVHVSVVTGNENKGDARIEKISKLSENNFKITFIYFDDSLLNGYEYKQCAHISKATIYRLFLGDIMPQTMSKVIYLDTDMFVCTDLQELFLENIAGKMLGAVVECADEDIDYIRTKQPYLYDYYDSEEELFELYFNAGMMLVNLDNFRKENVGARCVGLLIQHPEFICHDQDVLNIICKGKVKYVNPEWNRIWRRELADGREGTGCLAERREDIRIIHYCTGDKPWITPQYKLSDFFWRTAYETEWFPELIDKLLNSRMEYTFLYKFPMDKISFGDHILIYGFGEVGKMYVKQIEHTAYCIIDAFVDKDESKKMESEFQFISLKNLPLEYNNQKIVVAIKNEAIRKKVKLELVELLSVEEEMIITDFNDSVYKL